MLPVFLILAISLAVLNPVFNSGPLLIRQKRMGRGCEPFWMWKFRTMTGTEAGPRSPDAALDTHRITPLGGLLRRFRVDEVPQVLNVFAGDMSFIGPRPDLWEHAVFYSEVVPDYRLRYITRPGLTGLAQVTLGYSEGVQGALRKTRRDLHYIARASAAMDLRIVAMTIRVFIKGLGR